MTNRRVVLVAALLLPGIWVSVQSKLQGADEGKKAPDALQTVKAFLNFAFTGQAKAAADLGEPGKAYSREEKIKKEFERLDAKKPPAIISLHAADEAALAITEAVVTKDKKLVGSLSIRLAVQRRLLRKAGKTVDCHFGTSRVFIEKTEPATRYPRCTASQEGQTLAGP